MNTEDHATIGSTPPGIGHNQSPYEILKQRVERLIEESDMALSSYETIPDQNVANSFQTLIDMIGACAKEVEALRKEEKAPHDAAIKDIQARFKSLSENLDLSVSILQRRRNAFLDEQERIAEEARKAAEDEAEKRMEEAEKAEQAAAQSGSVSDQIAAKQAQEKADEAVQAVSAPVGPARVRGEFSARSTSGWRRNWKAQINDQDAVYAHFRSNQKVKDLLQQLADAEARSFKGEKTEGGTFGVPGATFRVEKAAA